MAIQPTESHVALTGLSEALVIFVIGKKKLPPPSPKGSQLANFVPLYRGSRGRQEHAVQPSGSRQHGDWTLFRRRSPAHGAGVAGARADRRANALRPAGADGADPARAGGAACGQDDARRHASVPDRWLSAKSRPGRPL